MLVNPYDVEGTAAAIHRALCMDRSERRRRIQALRAQVRENDVVKWTEGFITALAGSR